MYCGICKKTEATIHITSLSKGSYLAKHVCQKCMDKVDQPSLDQSVKRCPHCGISLFEIQKKGRFGCPRDYEVFEKIVVETLQAYHGGIQHRGKVPESRFF